MSLTANSRGLLIVFTRLSQPGLAKTRLIPALGAEGAAQLQRQMTQHTVNRARFAAQRDGLSLEVCYTGGERTDFVEWLGPDFSYRPQAMGNLGDRMAHAFAAAFERGHRFVVLVGTDCPQLDEHTLGRAFAALEAHDLVLGPAQDGGYYLIGLSQPAPALFRGIAWGTESVREQTLQRAAQNEYSYLLLDTLHDVDRPEDLIHWTAATAAAAPLSPRISVVIPTLNEAGRLGRILEALTEEPDVEVIVADGGSMDDTCKIAHDRGAQVLVTPPGRGRQMNVGAQLASGDVLLFLHADTVLSAGFSNRICAALGQPNVVAGAFRFQLDERTPLLRIVEWLTNLRASWFSQPYGDQALFMRADVFRELGGYREAPILEDVMLLDCLKRVGRIVILPEAATTSARRWVRLGVLRTFLLHRCVIAAYRLGVRPQTIALWLACCGYYEARQCGSVHSELGSCNKEPV